MALTPPTPTPTHQPSYQGENLMFIKKTHDNHYLTCTHFQMDSSKCDIVDIVYYMMRHFFSARYINLC